MCVFFKAIPAILLISFIVGCIIDLHDWWVKQTNSTQALMVMCILAFVSGVALVIAGVRLKSREPKYVPHVEPIAEITSTEEWTWRAEIIVEEALRENEQN